MPSLCTTASHISVYTQINENTSSNTKYIESSTIYEPSTKKLEIDGNFKGISYLGIVSPILQIYAAIIFESGQKNSKIFQRLDCKTFSLYFSISRQNLTSVGKGVNRFNPQMNGTHSFPSVYQEILKSGLTKSFVLFLFILVELSANLIICVRMSILITSQ